MKYKFRSFFEPILGWWHHKVKSKLQNFETTFSQRSKGMFHLKVPFTFDFHLSINIGTWNTNLELFDTFLDWWRHNMVSKHPNFEIVVSKRNTTLHLKFPFTIDFHLSITIGTCNTSLDPFWPNFGLMTSPRESNLQFFWERDLRNKLIVSSNSYFHLKVSLYIDFNLSIILDTWYTTLGKIWR